MAVNHSNCLCCDSFNLICEYDNVRERDTKVKRLTTKPSEDNETSKRISIENDVCVRKVGVLLQQLFLVISEYCIKTQCHADNDYTC